MKIAPIRETDISSLASLHIKALPETVSSKIGLFYLKRVYWTVVKNKKNNLAFVASEKGKIVGAVAATIDLKLFGDQFKKGLSLKDFTLIAAAIITFKVTPFEILNRFLFENQLLQNYKKSYVTITVLFVNKKFRGKGIGSALVKKIINQYRRKVSNIYVDTLLKNKKAIDFYRSLDFKTQKEIKDSVLLQYKP